jgi:hypothetical protein
MKRFLSDLKTQRVQADTRAVVKRVVRPGSDKLRRRSSGKVSG